MHARSDWIFWSVIWTLGAPIYSGITSFRDIVHNQTSRQGPRFLEPYMRRRKMFPYLPVVPMSSSGVSAPKNRVLRLIGRLIGRHS
ncbi:hypothetical protein B0H14DRAFT_1219257 [Mycena olivaceomarginata]|nr:hypothetical protein B0H14DRAFT_1219257 [Mycena olivaceomarginata]